MEAHTLLLYQAKPQVTSPGQGVDLLLHAEREVKAIEETLEAAKAYKRDLEVNILPDVFGNADTKRTESPSGAAALMGMHVEGSLPKVDEKATPEEQAAQEAAREAAIELCNSYGWGPLIKTTVSAAWDKGDREKALAAYERLRGDNSAVLKLKEDIHAMTLASQVKQRIKEGKGVDTATLGVTVLTAVKLTKRPKE